MTFFRDPRYYQISVLSGLLVYGLIALDFDVDITQVAVTLVSVLLIQYACTRLWRLPRFDPKSALISGLSLCLLLRTNFLWLVPVAAFITIASKFVLRVHNKHIFNPTNFGIVILLLTTDMIWVSPGQWGNVAFFGFLMACLGGLVVHRALRSDVAIGFALFYAGLLFGRSFYLGEPMVIPIHRLQSGGLLLFTFFMISDPRTTPDSRAGRFLFAALVAFGAWYVQFRLFRTNGVLWSLAACALLTPIIDWLMPGNRYQWNASSRKDDGGGMKVWKRMTGVTATPAMLAIATVAGIGLGFATPDAQAFCGFYVSKADTKIFNKASKVVIARDGDRTIMTMANDFKGELKEFAVVIPVPTMIQRDQIHVGEQAVIDHLDAFTAPRLVEYFDPDPCRPPMYEMTARAGAMPQAVPAPAAADRAKSLGVTIEATYTVGEYDILILSAKESGGLETWLRESGYRIPTGASSVLSSYIKQNMRFFVAKVNLKEQGKLGFSYLRPLQVAYESPKFMLPIRLGTVNAEGSQELFVMTLTRKGRVETTNYRTVRLPTGMDIPVYVKNDFAKFYTAMFDTQVKRENMSVVFLEYAWDMGWCDPCAADPLTDDELKKLGVFWLDGPPVPAAQQGGANPTARRPMPRPIPPRAGSDVFVTRLHVRYNGTTFPEDLVFQETTDRANFQGRYVLRHAFKGQSTCQAMETYRRELVQRYEREAQTLANLTGWPIADIRKQMGASAPPAAAGDDSAWWRRIWK